MLKCPITETVLYSAGDGGNEVQFLVWSCKLANYVLNIGIGKNSDINIILFEEFLIVCIIYIKACNLYENSHANTC